MRRARNEVLYESSFNESRLDNVYRNEPSGQKLTGAEQSICKHETSSLESIDLNSSGLASKQVKQVPGPTMISPENLSFNVAAANAVATKKARLLKQPQNTKVVKTM